MRPQYDLLKRFGTPTTKLKRAQKAFKPLLELHNSFRNLEIEQQQKEVLLVLSYDYLLYSVIETILD